MYPIDIYAIYVTIIYIFTKTLVKRNFKIISFGEFTLGNENRINLGLLLFSNKLCFENNLFLFLPN